MVEGKISRDGILSIKRASKLQLQTCPFNTNQHCGDWCPLLGEPDPYNEGVRLTIACANSEIAMWVFDKFKDERE